MLTIRDDIQALRGLAVLLVVVYHAAILPLDAGYLGVDIFFVISGYLITGLIIRDDFRPADFYVRRIKRLLPAAYTVFLLTALGAAFILTETEYQAFIRQLWGALTFTGNHVLLEQTGYFDGEAGLKPLLHVWSLAIEEQYYLILPILLWALPRRFWRDGLILLAFVSLIACFVIALKKPETAFYLLPTRLWELAIGSIGAVALRDLRIPDWLYWSALGALLILPFAPTGLAHPGMDALLICLATLVVILAKRPFLNNPGLVAIGNISYSLYLVHWPLFAFAAHIWLEQTPLEIRVGVFFLSFALAYILHCYVEQPIRRTTVIPSWRLGGITVAASLILAMLPLWMSTGDSRYAELRRPSVGLDPACDMQKTTFSPVPACRNGERPKVMVWGDSYAMHLVPGLAALMPNGLIQATRSFCGPILDLAPMRTDPTSSYKERWAEDCHDFNASVIAYLEITPSIETVVLSSWFSQYTDASAHANLAPDGTTVQPSIARASKALDTTIDRLNGLGKTVFVVSPPPRADFDVGLCLEREATGKPVGRPCDIQRETHQRLSSDVTLMLKQSSAEVIWLDTILCTDTDCRTRFDGIPLYRDAGHLTVDGSIALAEHFKSVVPPEEKRLVKGPH